MPVVSENPFAALTAVIAPAMLTNACSLLVLGTANRIARVVDRTREVTALRAPLEPGSRGLAAFSVQLEHLRARGGLLFRALRIFYASIGAFAASALSAVVGSALAAYDLPVAFHAAAAVGLAIGTAGVSALVAGCALMVRETRLAIRSVAEEAELAGSR